MRTLQLSKTVNVVLNSSGNGTAMVGPTFPGEIWYPTVVSVSASTNVAEAACKIYAGTSVQAFFFVDGTLSGSTGDSSDRITGQTLYPGHDVIAAWSGGDVGATATMNVTGTRTVP